MTAARHPFAVELRALLAIAAPLAAANVAQMLMGLTSTIMVGHLGSAALASAGLGGSLYFTLVIVCRSVLAAVAPLAAHAIGADEHHELHWRIAAPIACRCWRVIWFGVA